MIETIVGILIVVLMGLQVVAQVLFELQILEWIEQNKDQEE